MLNAEAVKRQARTLGFDLCGIAPVDNHAELSFLQEWLDRGYAGEMAWIGRSADRRADVRNVMPDARCVIVTGTVYSGPTPPPPSGDAGSPPVGIIARYARGDDYHDVLTARLDALVSWMRAESSESFDARAYVDTGPVQERVYAQYGGLGWIGKNTCLINAELGSWLFLAEIICSLPLEPDTQGLEQCGACNKCIEACPTGALVEPGVLDSNRCLSYLTIELRGSIAEEHRAALGVHVYGCDICQDVCPYNQVPPRSDDRAWHARPGLDLPRLIDLWRRPDTELLRLTKGSAMRRAKLTGLRRNLAVAIGNSGDEEACSALAESSAERPSADDPMVREHVQWAMGQRARAKPFVPRAPVSSSQ
ncbi:MAG: tRNA epoxyqueuosine(34) reductase QueG [Vicinamibacterales bacterium]